MPRLVFGLLSPRCRHDARKRWNVLFSSRGIDAFVDFYRTVGARDLELRFSEMFLHERRGYLLFGPLRRTACDFLDALAPSARRKRQVDVVVNDRGALVGHFVGGRGGEWPTETVLSLWFPRPAVR